MRASSDAANVPCQTFIIERSQGDDVSRRSHLFLVRRSLSIAARGAQSSMTKHRKSNRTATRQTTKLTAATRATRAKTKGTNRTETAPNRRRQPRGAPNTGEPAGRRIGQPRRTRKHVNTPDATRVPCQTLLPNAARGTRSDADKRRTTRRARTSNPWMDGARTKHGGARAEGKAQAQRAESPTNRARATAARHQDRVTRIVGAKRQESKVAGDSTQVHSRASRAR